MNLVVAVGGQSAAMWQTLAMAPKVFAEEAQHELADQSDAACTGVKPRRAAQGQPAPRKRLPIRQRRGKIADKACCKLYRRSSCAMNSQTTAVCSMTCGSLTLRLQSRRRDRGQLKSRRPCPRTAGPSLPRPALMLGKHTPRRYQFIAKA